MVRTRRYIYSPRGKNSQDPKIFSKEKRLSLLNQSRNLFIEEDESVVQPTKKSKKFYLNKSKEIIPKTPAETPSTSIIGNKTIHKQSSGKVKAYRRRISLNKSLNSKSINSLKALKKALNKSLKNINRRKKCKKSKSNSENVKKKKRKHSSLDTSSEKINQFKRRKLGPVTSTPINKEMAKREKIRKNKQNRTTEQKSVYNPEYHLQSTLKLTDNTNIIDVQNQTPQSAQFVTLSQTPQPAKFVTLSQTPINQHLSIHLPTHLYNQFKTPDANGVIEIDDDDDDDVQAVDYINLLTPSVANDETLIDDDDSCIIIDETPRRSTATATQMTPRPSTATQMTPRPSTATQMTPRSSSCDDIIEIGTQMTPQQSSVSTNTSAKNHQNVMNTMSMMTVPHTNNNVVTQTTATSIYQFSNNVQHQLVSQNFHFQQHNGEHSNWVQNVRQLENQYIHYASRALPDNEFGNNIYNPNRIIKQGLRLIVIDGSNVAMGHSNGKYFSCEGLKICIDYFLKRGHNVKAFVPQYRRQNYQTSNPKLLEYLNQQRIVIFTPSRRVNGRLIVPYDDRFIVQCAAQSEGVIVSNDNYRDLLIENSSWQDAITKRLLMWTWCGDMIMFPSDPCGRGGPSLDEFLRF